MVRKSIALAGIGVRRILGRVRNGNTARIAVSVLGVAAAVALVLTATGISAGLATQSTVAGDGVDYWVVPESASSSSLAVSAGSAQFGNVHQVSTKLNSDPRIQYATPVSIQVLRVGGAEGAYVLTVGVIAEDGVNVLGLDTAALTSGDPHYANGTYEGNFTSEMLLSSGSAELLNASTGETLSVQVPGGGASQNFTTVSTGEGGVSTGAGDVPVAIVHLSELQTLTGTADGDTADQILVATNDAGVREMLAGLYPESNVVSSGGLSVNALADSSLSLAVALGAALVALVIGTLFVATTMGMELTADQAQFATLAAIGLSKRSRGTIVIAQTLTVTLSGGILGIALGYGLISLTNLGSKSLIGMGVASFPLVLASYGLFIATIIGLLSAPYLLWLSGRSDPIEQL